MLTYLPLIALITTAPVHTPTLDVKHVKEIVDEMTFPGMDVTVKVGKCGVVNAYYAPWAKTVLICQEMIDQLPQIVPAVVAHEMAHAVIHQLDIPFTGSEEDAADELAAVVLGNTGHADDLLEAALWFKAMSDSHDRSDPHSPASRRSWTLACLADGSELVPVLDECGERFERATRNWHRLIFSALNFPVADEDLEGS